MFQIHQIVNHSCEFRLEKPEQQYKMNKQFMWQTDIKNSYVSFMSLYSKNEFAENKPVLELQIFFLFIEGLRSELANEVFCN